MSDELQKNTTHIESVNNDILDHTFVKAERFKNETLWKQAGQVMKLKGLPNIQP